MLNRIALILPLLLLCALAAMGRAAAQECRNPTPRERAAILKAVNTLEQTLVTPLNASGWEVDRDQSALTKQIVVATNADPPRPIFDCSTFFTVRLAASASNPHAAAARDAMQQITAQSSPSDIQRLAAIMASAYIDLRATINNPQMPSSHKPMKRLNVPGASLAYQVEGNDPGTLSTTLCYGGVPFRHAPGTPYIENLCLDIRTSSALTHQILSEIYWSALKQALTR